MFYAPKQFRNRQKHDQICLATTVCPILYLESIERLKIDMETKNRNNKSKYILFVIILLILLIGTAASLKRPKVDNYNKFKEENLTITSEDELAFIKKNIIKTSVPKDGIPPIDSPNYFNSVKEAEESGEIVDEDIVFGVNYEGFIAAYPKDIMYWHEIVNEEVNSKQISVTYCPLTATIIGYKGHSLGVSGSLYNSNLVMYDRETQGFIPQISGEFIDGEKRGEKLEAFKVDITSWEKWKSKYPNTKLLSRKTGSFRAYDNNPYPGYDSILQVWFPLVAESDELHRKEIVFGIEKNASYVAIQKEGFKDKYPSGLEVQVGGETFKITYNSQLEIIETNKDVKSFEGYWFAWYAYHPETELIKTK